MLQAFIGESMANIGGDTAKLQELQAVISDMLGALGSGHGSAKSDPQLPYQDAKARAEKSTLQQH